ncbi:MAG: phosphatase PAP2 family protein [Tepidiformaceae bacterium]
MGAGICARHLGDRRQAIGALLEATEFHGIGGPTEGVLLAGCLAVALSCLWRAAGPGFALLNGLGAAAGFLLVGHVAIPLAVALMALLLWRRPGEAGSRRLRFVPYFGEWLVVLAGLAAYTALRAQIESPPGPAMAHARDAIAFERGLHLYFEPRLQETVTNSEAVTRAFSGFYSFGFLAVIAAVLPWLYARDRANYRLFRNCLGISAGLAVVTIGLYPVAPPRLVAEAGLIDTVTALGREHAFANEYAAIPSLHVGWMALVGLVVGRSIGGRRGLALGLVPGPLMGLTVVVTGNHYWIDGAIGAAFTLVPAALLLHPRALPVRRLALRAARATGQAVGATAETVRYNRRVRWSMLALGGLLLYMFVARVLNPGFTTYWGYLVFQMAGTMMALLAGEVVFAGHGGVSWQTHFIAVVCSYLDTLGTDGHLYARIDEYDKLTHFMGVAAVTSGAYDCFRGLSRRGLGGWTAEGRLLGAVAVGIAVGVAWEVYEYIGDNVFDTARIGGMWDTSNDLVSDALGALTAGLVLWLVETGRLGTRRPQGEERERAPG